MFSKDGLAADDDKLFLPSNSSRCTNDMFKLLASHIPEECVGVLEASGYPKTGWTGAIADPRPIPQ